MEIAGSVVLASLIGGYAALKSSRNATIGILSGGIEWAALFTFWATAVSASIVQDFTVVLTSGAAVFSFSAVLFSWAPFCAWRAAVWVLLGVLAVVFEIWAAVGVFFFQTAAVVIKNWFHGVGYATDGFLGGHPWDVGETFIAAVLTFTTDSWVSLNSNWGFITIVIII